MILETKTPSTKNRILKHRGGAGVVLVAGGRLPARGGVVVDGGGLYGRGVILARANTNCALDRFFSVVLIPF